MKTTKYSAKITTLNTKKYLYVCEWITKTTHPR